MSPLSPSILRDGLRTRCFGQHGIHYYLSTDSTNERARQAAVRGDPEGTLFVAEQQTKGRGQRGRSWFSSETSALTMTLLLRPPFPARHVSLLAPLFSVALCEAIRKRSSLEPRVKWPNDLLINGKKAAGILVESATSGEHIEYAVIGIGLNINTQRSAFPDHLREAGTSLLIETGEQHDRADVARAILAASEKCYLQALEHGFDSTLESWRCLSETLGRHVRIVQGNALVQGRAEDISPEGALLIRQQDGSLLTILSGSIQPAPASQKPPYHVLDNQ